MRVDEPEILASAYAAHQKDTVKERFGRIRKLLGEERFSRLQCSRVTLVGLGAVGGYVAEGLARAGVGHLRLVDYDIIQPTNINRQILALDSTLGEQKVVAASRRIIDINPHCFVETLPVFVAEETLEMVLNPAPDLLIDAIDSLNPKTQLLAGAYFRRIPTLSSMGAALRTDPGKVQMGDLFDSHNCPLARHLRKRLRRRGVGRGIRAVFSSEKVDFDYQQEDEEPTSSAPYADRGRKRNALGSLPTLTGIFGLILANEALLQLASESGPIFTGEAICPGSL